MDEIPLVSLIMPARNHAGFVATALRSLLAQTHPRLELIVIDDGSQDATPEVIAATLAAAPPRRGLRCLFLRQENRGLAATLTRALALAEGHFVQFLASDDALFPQMTARLVAALAAAPPEVAAIGCDGYVFDGRQRGHLPFSCLHPRPWGRDQYREMMVGNWLPAMGMLYRRQALQAVGGFDPGLVYEDWGLLLALARRYRLGQIPDRLFLYRQHGANISQQPAAMQAAQAALGARHPAMQAARDWRRALARRDLRAVLAGISPATLGLAWRHLCRDQQRRLARQSPAWRAARALAPDISGAESLAPEDLFPEDLLLGDLSSADAAPVPLAARPGRILRGPGCQIAPGAELIAEGGDLVLGAGVRIEAGVRLRAGAGGIAIGPLSTLAAGARIEGTARLGRGVLLAEGAVLRSAAVLGDRAVLGPGVEGPRGGGRLAEGQWLLGP